MPACSPVIRKPSFLEKAEAARDAARILRRQLAHTQWTAVSSDLAAWSKIRATSELTAIAPY